MDSREEIISIVHLKKEFKVPLKESEGLLPAIRQLFKRQYRVVAAVNDISMSIRKGEVRALIGPNGSGKSTTIKILTGILFPDSGTVTVAGFTPWVDRKTYVRKVGVVTGQRSQMIWDLPPIDTFAFNREIYRIPKERYQRTLKAFIELLELDEILKRPVRQLSLGERMKCELVASLLHEPEIVFLDEPTIGLDLNAKAAMHLFIKEINKKKNTTIILTTHDLGDVENLCENVTVINKGAIIYNDSLHNLKGMVSNKRIINLSFNEAVGQKALSEYEVIEMKTSGAKLKVDISEKNIQEWLAGIIKKVPCMDITIESIGIEEIISQIYSS